MTGTLLPTTSGLTTLNPVTPQVDPPQILALQSPPLAPQHDALTVGTNLLNVPPRTEDRFDSIPPEVYDLSSTSHLSRFLKVLTGNAGAGQLRQRMMAARMSTVVQGANFYDLDSFYGALFGVSRQSDEQLPLNPYSDMGTADTWSSVQAIDSAYRARIDQFGKAVSMGPSAIGMELVSEAILQTPCTITESWTVDDSGVRTWAMVEAIGTYSQLQNYTYGQLEQYNSNLGIPRNVFTVTPHRSITAAETFDLRRVLNTLKPANTLVNINSAGWAVHSPVATRGVSADSSFWHFTKSVIPTATNASYYNLSSTVQVGGWREVLLPPFSQYQGEQISYGGDITLVSGYDIDPFGNQLPNPVVDAYTFYDGLTLYYPPNYGVLSRFYEVNGRVVSDAILQSAPYSERVGTVPTATNALTTGTQPSVTGTPVQSLYVDGLPILNAIESIGSSVTGPQLGSQPLDQRFWSTPPRPSSDSTVENLEIDLAGERLINYVNFSLAHFPQSADLQIHDDVAGAWVTVWTTTIYDSAPAIIPQIVQGHEHPQHSGPGAWIPYEISVPPSTSSKVRLQLTRLANGTPPVTQAQPVQPVLSGVQPAMVSTPVPYSLGVKGMNLGYLVQQESDLPSQALTTTDFLGSQVLYAVRTEAPQNAINGGSIPWRSAPQPTSNSVVNFFLDTRDSAGQAQVADSFYIDPLFVGPHCNLYYSNDNTAGTGFSAETTPLVPPVTSTTGTVTNDFEGLIFAPSTPSYVDINNTAIQFDPSQPWWLAVALRPNFNCSAGSGQTVWDIGNGMTLSFGPNIVTLTVGLQSTTVPTAFTAGTTVYLSVAYYPVDSNDFQAGIYLTYSDNINPTVYGEPLVYGAMVEPIEQVLGVAKHLISSTPGSFVPTTVYSPPADLRFGGKQNTPVAGNFKLLGVVLKQQAALQDDISAFSTDWQSYTEVSSFGTTDATTDSILRFNILYLTGADTTGFVGGPGNFWAQLNWTPVARDFTVAKGFMQFSPTLAKFWKFEFTNLVAQPFNSFIPITKTLNTLQGLPSSIAQSSSIGSLNEPGAGSPAQAIVISSAETLNYSDSAYVPPGIQPPPASNVTQPTAMQTAQDYSVQQTVSQTGWYWQFQEWGQSPAAPRFVSTGQHTYSTQTVQQSSLVSYFMGLNSIAPYRTSFTADNSPEIYDEFFLDDVNISSPLPQNPGDLNSAGLTFGVLPLVCESVVYPSSRSVSAVQFASMQSDAVQITYNDDFAAPFPSNYDWSGITNSYTSIRAIGDAVCSWNSNSQTILVSRNTGGSPAPAVPTPGSEGIIERMPFPVAEEIDTTLGAPAITVTPTGSGSTAYAYEMVALTPTGLTPASNIATCVNNATLGGAVYNTVNWSGVPGALAYYIYGRTASNLVLLSTPLAATATSYTDSGASPYVFSGGLASASGLTGTKGHVWAAVRVTAPTALTSNLTLQLIDQTTSTVVASTPVTCVAGQTVTAYCGYQLGSLVAAGGPIFAQIIQTGPATDVFIVNRLSVFDDGLLWEFSNDSGTTWVQPFGVRNKPYGLTSFPNPNGNQLRWRVTVTRPNMHINALRVRPIYVGVQADNPQGVLQGPNLSITDQAPPIDEDPMFQLWSNPIPYWWYPISADYPALGISGPISPESSGHFYERLSSDSVVFGGDSAGRTMAFLKYVNDIIPTSDVATATVSRSRTTADGTHIGNSETATATVFVEPVVSDLVQPVVHDID